MKKTKHKASHLGT